MTLYHFPIFLVKAGSIHFLDQVNNDQQANLTAYQRLIGIFIYLSCETRPDIAFVIGQLSCHNSDLRIEHLCIVKLVLHYLKKTITLDIK